MQFFRRSIGHAIILVISLTCTSHRVVKPITVPAEKPPAPDCVYKVCDSLLPFIDGLDSLVCAQYATHAMDTIYFTDNLEPFVDSAFMRNIVTRFSGLKATVLFSNYSDYPLIIIKAEYARCICTLNVGRMAGHLAGRGLIYELIKVGERYKIGRVVSNWIS